MSLMTKNNQFWWRLKFARLTTTIRRNEYSTLTSVESPDDVRSQMVNGQLRRLIQAYRDHGHRLARLNPLISHDHHHISKTALLPELEPERYGLSENDPVIYDLHSVTSSGPQTVQLSQVLDLLKKTYCGPLTFEYSHLPEEEREWFTNIAESIDVNVKLNDKDKKQLAFDMLKSQAFDKFVGTKFPTLKRYSGEGAESAMVFFERLFRCAVQHGTEQVIICMAHRGRLNLLTNLLEYPAVNMFRKMKGMKEFPQETATTGDVLHHLTSSVDLEFDGGKVHVTMLPNPSHLEAVNPVAVGKARGRQMSLRNSQQRHTAAHEDVLTAQDKLKVLAVQVHGDAAFAAQGIVMETLAMSQLPQYGTAGSVHLVINNQIGFTTPVERARSSLYCTDIAKMIQAPVIHVNGDYPEEVVRATIAAMDYRQKFAKDVFVDIVCFRRWGHNEMDDPTITNPQMYQQIHARTSIPDRYAEALVKNKVLTPDEISYVADEHHRYLNDEFNKVDTYSPTNGHFEGNWKGFMQAASAITTWNTGMNVDLLRYIGIKSVQVPKDFTVHSHVEKTHIQNRRSKLESGKNLDWATAESLAIGSLLYQGFDVRISGQDVGRGTFSHRHAVLTDQNTEETYIPLNDIVDQNGTQGYFEVGNSILSEEAVMGFEYGMSIENPRRLVIWEAQFGDFFNGAQIIVDTFVASAKWLLQSGLVLLLPHGYDGAGPEHSSCRLERFLQLSDSKEETVDGDDVNMRVTNPTTPAQYFHLLRSQMLRNFRKPLIVASPKILLRLAAATSDLREFESGTTFRPVIGDDQSTATSSSVSRLIFCSGKHYYALAKHRGDTAAKDTAIIRIECLCPFPTDELQAELKKYPNVTSFVWSQEEPQNMGPWSFVFPRFLNLTGVKLTYSGRKPMATPAVGIGKLHHDEATHILNHPFSIKS